MWIFYLSFVCRCVCVSMLYSSSICVPVHGHEMKNDATDKKFWILNGNCDFKHFAQRSGWAGSCSRISWIYLLPYSKLQYACSSILNSQSSQEFNSLGWDAVAHPETKEEEHGHRQQRRVLWRYKHLGHRVFPDNSRLGRCVQMCKLMNLSNHKQLKEVLLRFCNKHNRKYKRKTPSRILNQFIRGEYLFPIRPYIHRFAEPKDTFNSSTWW